MYDRVKIKAEARQSFHMNFGTALGVALVGAIILSASEVIPFAPLILSGVIEFGMATVLLSVVRNQNPRFEDMFKGFNNFGTTCGAGVLVSVFTFLWTLLFVIPGIIKSYSYSMTFYILADNPNMTPSEAIDASKKMMNGHKFDLFVLQLSFIGWFLLCGITFGLALIYVLPYYQSAVAKFYDTLKDEQVVIG